MSEVMELSHDLAAARLSQTLQIYIGQGRPLSVTALAEATGIPERTVKAYRAAEATPGLGNTLKLCGALRAPFTNGLLEVVGLGGVRDLDQGKAPHASDIVSHMCRQAGDIATMLADGRVDHCERAALRKSLPSLIALLEAFNSTLDD